MFMKIAKAYEACVECIYLPSLSLPSLPSLPLLPPSLPPLALRLTDEVSRANWEKYGNPDGPRAASFGIALPAWIVEKQNSIIVRLPLNFPPTV